MKHIAFQLTITAVTWCWVGVMLGTQNWIAAAINAIPGVWMIYWDVKRMPDWVSWS